VRPTNNAEQSINLGTSGAKKISVWHLEKKPFQCKKVRFANLAYPFRIVRNLVVLSGGFAILLYPFHFPEALEIAPVEQMRCTLGSVPISRKEAILSDTAKKANLAGVRNWNGVRRGSQNEIIEANEDWEFCFCQKEVIVPYANFTECGR